MKVTVVQTKKKFCFEFETLTRGPISISIEDFSEKEAAESIKNLLPTIETQLQEALGAPKPDVEEEENTPSKPLQTVKVIQTPEPLPEKKPHNNAGFQPTNNRTTSAERIDD